MLYVDTAPHSDSAALEAARTADLVLIPCRPAILDLEAITNTLAFLRTTGTPVLVVLNAIAATGQDARLAEHALSAHDVETCPVRLGRRIAFARSLVSGQVPPRSSSPTARPPGKIRELHTFVLRRLQDFNPSSNGKPTLMTNNAFACRFVQEILAAAGSARGLAPLRCPERVKRQVTSEATSIPRSRGVCGCWRRKRKPPCRSFSPKPSLCSSPNAV